MVSGYSVIPFNTIIIYYPQTDDGLYTGCMYNDMIVYLDMNDEPYNILRMKWPNKCSVYIDIGHMKKNLKYNIRLYYIINILHGVSLTNI